MKRKIGFWLGLLMAGFMSLALMGCQNGIGKVIDAAEEAAKSPSGESKDGEASKDASGENGGSEATKETSDDERPRKITGEGINYEAARNAAKNAHDLADDAAESYEEIDKMFKDLEKDTTSQNTVTEGTSR